MAISNQLKENYTISPSDEVQIHSIQLDFIRAVGGASGRTFVNAYDSNTPLNLKREDGVNIAVERRWFKISVPPVNDRGVVAGSLDIENVDLAITDILKSIEGTLNPIELTYRIYLSNSTHLPPLVNPPPVFYLSNAVISANLVRFKLVHPNLVNRNYPSRVYTISDFPQLIGVQA